MSILQDILVGPNLVQLYGDIGGAPTPIGPPAPANPGGQTGKQKVTFETLIADASAEPGFTCTLTSPHALQLTGAPAEVRPSLDLELFFDPAVAVPVPLLGLEMAPLIAAATDEAAGVPATITVDCPIIVPGGGAFAVLARLTVDWSHTLTN